MLRRLNYITLFFLMMTMIVIIPSGNVMAQNKPVAIRKNSSIKLPIKQTKETLARSYYYRGNYEKAARLYRELYIKEKKYIYYNYYYNSLIYLKNYKEAEKLCKKQSRLTPENVRYKIDLAYVYSLEEQDKKANKIIERITQNLPHNRNLVINIANNLQSKGFVSEALSVYKIAKNSKIGNYSYNLEMATAYQYAGDYNKMFDALINHLDENPDEIPRVESKIQSILVMDVNDNLSKTFKNKILSKAQSDPDNAVYAELLMWYSLQVKDFDLALRQAKSIERRYKDQEEIMLEVADIAYSNERYDIASNAYEYLMKKKDSNPYYGESYNGYFLSRIKLAEANPDSNIKTWEELTKIGNHAIKELGINRSTSDIVCNLAHIEAFRLNKTESASAILNKAILIRMPQNKKALLKMELADILSFSGKFWDASLLYSQVEHDLKNDPTGYEAKFRNARIFYYKGEFEWAKTRLDILKGATSKLIANDALELSMFIKTMLEEDSLGLTLRLFAAADQYSYQQKYDSALNFLSKAEKQSSGNIAYEFALYKKASIYEKLKKYNVADSLYTELYSQYSESVKADNALFSSAEINRLNLNNNTKASELYLKLMKEYPESIYATKARKEYRKLNSEGNTTNTL